jgi:hypothetical protein
MSIDYEQLARFVELARTAWPDDSVSITLNANGMNIAAGTTHIVLAHKDLALFETALLALNAKPEAVGALRELTALKRRLARAAELWEVRGRDNAKIGREAKDAQVLGESQGMLRCAHVLRMTLAGEEDVMRGFPG